jgi:hypothetical protein
MAEARDIYGTVFKNGSATLLARVLGAGGTPVQRADVASVAYSVCLLDDQDPDFESPVSGHTAVGVRVSDVLYDDLQTDAIWTQDALGYNFKLALDIAAHPAFPIAGRSCRIAVKLVPASGPTILFRFRVHVI